MGIRSKRQEYNHLLSTYGKSTPKLHPEHFYAIDHVGYFYIPNELEYRHLIMEKDESDLPNKDMIRCKLIEVTEDHITYVYYDDHHHRYILCNKEPSSNLLLIGNELILKSIYEKCQEV